MKLLGYYNPITICRSGHCGPRYKVVFNTKIEGTKRIGNEIHTGELYKWLFRLHGVNERTLAICKEYAMKKVSLAIDLAYANIEHPYTNWF